MASAAAERPSEAEDDGAESVFAFVLRLSSEEMLALLADRWCSLAVFQALGSLEKQLRGGPGDAGGGR